MCQKRKISVETCAVIIALHAEGYSSRQIASKTNVSQTTVVRTLQRKKEAGQNKSRQRSARPRIMSKREDKFIRIQSKRQRTRTAPEMREELNATQQKIVSVSTVQRYRKLCQYLLYNVAENCAKKHVTWSLEQWSKVLFTNESKFELFGSKRRQYVGRLFGERMTSQCLLPTVKHGGCSVMIWGCFAGDKVEDLIRIEGIMDKKYYHRILQCYAFPCGQRIIGQGFVFQQDNDPKH
nr:uncharacterized protein LOC122273754 [Parasteatoda tepidariorum]